MHIRSFVGALAAVAMLCMGNVAYSAGSPGLDLIGLSPGVYDTSTTSVYHPAPAVELAEVCILDVSADNSLRERLPEATAAFDTSLIGPDIGSTTAPPCYNGPPPIPG